METGECLRVISGKKDSKLALYPFITSVCLIPSEPSTPLRTVLKLRPKTFEGTRREKMEDKCDVFVYLYASFKSFNIMNDLFWVAGSDNSNQLWVEHVPRRISYIIPVLFSSHICSSGGTDSFHVRLTMNYELACLSVMIPHREKSNNKDIANRYT